MNNEIKAWEGKYRSKLELFAGKGEDRDVANVYNRAISKYSNDLKKMVRLKKAQIISERALAGLSKSLDKQANRYANALSDSEREMVMNEVEIEANTVFLTHSINEKQRDDVVKGFKKQGQVATLVNAKSTEDPNQIRNVINRLDKGEFDSFDIEERATARAQLSQSLKLAEKSKETEAEKLSIENGYNVLKSQYKTDYQGMFQALSNPKWLKENNLSSQRKHNLEIILRAEGSTFYNNIQDDFLTKLQKGTLTEGEIMRSQLPATGLGQGDKTWFLDKLNTKRLKGDEGFIHSNPRIYGETLRDIIINPDKWDKNKIFSIMGTSDSQGKPTGLSANDAGQLWKLWESQKTTDPVIAKKFTSIQQVLERLETYRKNYFFIEPETEGEIKPQEAVKNDQNHYLVQQNLLERIEKGEDPFTALGEIMKPYTQNKSKSWFDKYFGGVTNFLWPPAPEKPLPKGKSPFAQEGEKINKPTPPPPGNKEGRYDIGGIEWKWTKTRGWYQ